MSLAISFAGDFIYTYSLFHFAKSTFFVFLPIFAYIKMSFHQFLDSDDGFFFVS